MNAPRQPFWGWPGWKHLGRTLVLGMLFALWFALVYGGADYLTGLHHYRIRLHLDADLHLPFLPAAVLGYMSIYPLFWMAPFILRTGPQVRALTATLTLETFCGGVCFLICPGQVAFPVQKDLGAWDVAVRFAQRLALTYNFMPSLHVALSATCVTVYAAKAGWLGKAVLWLWAGIIGLSTLLLHQHYAIDVVTGYGLALAAVRLIYDRFSR
jgi:membrane-associated phospholipid phosphatase